MIKTRIAVIDEQELFRKSLCSLLVSYDYLSIMCEADSITDFIAEIKKGKVDVLLLDSGANHSDGIQSLKVVTEKFPEVKIIILSSHTTSNALTEFMIYGAKGFLTKDCRVNTLLEAIEDVQKNKYYFRQNISYNLLEKITKEEKPKNTFKLTARQLEIINQLCEGKSHKQIANSLFITTRTVDFHKANIYKKTNTDCNVSLCRFAIENNLIETKRS